MNKAEFTDRVKGLKFEDVNEEDWEIINTVYAYHPMISDVKGKDEIAALYTKGGMGIMNDMFPTANVISINESMVHKNNVTLEKLEKTQLDEMQALITKHRLEVENIIHDSKAANNTIAAIIEKY
jgi:hypothetical protein